MTRATPAVMVGAILLMLAAIPQAAIAQTRGYSASFGIGGAVERPRSYTLADLQAMPAEQVEVEFTSGGRPQRHTYTGVLLHTLLMAAGPRFDPASTHDGLRFYVTVVGTDGFTAVIAWGELAPEYGARPPLVAYLEDGEPMAGAGMARLVAPGDHRGSRYVSNITSIVLLPAQQPVTAAHAGSLNAVLTRDIGPAFTAASGIPFQNTSGPSVGLANQIRSSALKPDVYLTADAINIADLLIGAQNGDLARWYLVMARQQMVIAYSPRSRFAPQFAAVAAGATPWYEALALPGLVLKRGDPRVDPGGYRSYFTLLLAERHYGILGLAEQLSGGAENLAQIEGYNVAGLIDGTIDAAITYRSNAVDAGLPFVTLPEEIDQSNPALEAAYRVVSYTNPQGQVFHGSALVYGATVLEGAPNRVGAEAFLAFLLSERGRAMLAARGFLPADTLVGGDASAVPASLRGLIQGRYAP